MRTTNQLYQLGRYFARFDGWRDEEKTAEAQRRRERRRDGRETKSEGRLTAEGAEDGAEGAETRREETRDD
jgi:hypothetical protein